jgi:hypothetical protein
MLADEFTASPAVQDALAQLERDLHTDASPRELAGAYARSLRDITRRAEDRRWLFFRALGRLQHLLDETKQAADWRSMQRIAKVIDALAQAASKVSVGGPVRGGRRRDDPPA